MDQVKYNNGFYGKTYRTMIDYFESYEADNLAGLNSLLKALDIDIIDVINIETTTNYLKVWYRKNNAG